MSTPRPAPAELLAALLAWLRKAVAARSFGGALAGPLIVLIWRRLSVIERIFVGLAARLAAGRYVPRRTSRRAPAGHRPRPPDPLPRRPGWLIALVPEAAVSAAQLRSLFVEPETAALLATAPPAMARCVRSLCRMLGVDPPPMPRPPRSARPTPDAVPAPEAAAPRPAAKPPDRPRRPRTVFGLRYPPPLPNPA